MNAMMVIASIPEDPCEDIPPERVEIAEKNKIMIPNQAAKITPNTEQV